MDDTQWRFRAEIPAGKQKTLTTEAELLSYAVNCVRFYFGRCMCDCSLCVYEISRESLNGFVPNSQGRRVWSLAQRVSMPRSKIKG